MKGSVGQGCMRQYLAASRCCWFVKFFKFFFVHPSQAISSADLDKTADRVRCATSSCVAYLQVYPAGCFERVFKEGSLLFIL